MNLPILRRLPFEKVGILKTHPEPHHLRVLYAMACRCGPSPVFVEHGPTGGQVTHILLEAMKQLPGSELVVLGEIPEHLPALIEEAGMAGRTSFTAPTRTPSLWFIGRPEFAHTGVEQALAANSRVIVVYDSRTAERFGHNRYIPSALAARRLMEDPERTWSSQCDSLSGQHTRRGMLISESNLWHPQAVEESVPALPVPRGSRFQLGANRILPNS